MQGSAKICAFLLTFSMERPIKRIDVVAKRRLVSAGEQRNTRTGLGNGFPKEEVNMTIEPISSMMTVQLQGSTVQKAQPVRTDVTPESAASASTQEAARVDLTTKVVDNAQERGQSGSGEQGREQSASSEQIRKAVEQMNKNMANSEAVFGIHEGTNRVTIKIVNKDTKEVIKELPPEKTLDMIARVWDMAGILVDERR